MPAIFAITGNGGIYYKYNVIQCLLWSLLLTSVGYRELKGGQYEPL